MPSDPKLKAKAEKLAGKGALAWCLHPDGRMEVIAKDGKDLWFEAAEVKAASSSKQAAPAKSSGVQASGSTPKQPTAKKTK